mmetsp:Transcript_26987/g.38693  ORF Transcript_26987/g.38693 Transcript_26987/m.38693 type:complete len:206 (+) Transcript_26987:1069-1686(+)
MAGMSVEAPGKFTPARLLISPELSIVQVTLPSWTFAVRTVSATAPSSNNTVIPGCKHLAILAKSINKSVEEEPASRHFGEVCNVMMDPFSKVIVFFPDVSPCSLPVRISGPRVSKRTARKFETAFVVNLCPCRPLQSFRFFIRSSTSSTVAWLKFNLIMRNPESTSCCNTGSCSEEGPIVPTIFVIRGVHIEDLLLPSSLGLIKD